MAPHSRSSGQPVATILSVGTELTEGSIQDTHGRFVSESLHALGVRTREIILIPDDASQFYDELSRLARACDVVIITGGLGPTRDDLTREAVAAVADVELQFREELWREIEERFSGRAIAHTNRKQALIPFGFTAIRNPHGTAPGFWGRVAASSGDSSGTLVVALPGPPRELRPLFRNSVVEILERELVLRKAEELRATVFLLSESLLEQFLQEHRRGSVEWGTRAEPFRLVLNLRGGTADDREALFSALQQRLGWLRARRGEVEANELVLDALKKTSGVLCAAESCTGGLFGKLLTDLSGASQYFWGSLVVYSNSAKTRVLGVPEELIELHGAVSAETVRAMAKGALELADANVSCSISGVAGPSGGTPEKPVGTVWIGVARKGADIEQREYHFSGDRDMVRRKSVVAALLMCEATIHGKEVDNRELWQYI